MKQIAAFGSNRIILEGLEVLALFDGGLTLNLWNHQSVVIKAVGEKQDMGNGNIKVLMVNAEGDGDTLGAVLREAFGLINDSSVQAPPPLAPAAIAPPALSEVADRVPKNLKTKKGRARYDGPPLKCRKCGRDCATPQARGKHEGVCNGKSAGAYEFECGACDKKFSSAQKRDEHEKVCLT